MRLLAFMFSVASGLIAFFAFMPLAEALVRGGPQ